MFLLLRRGTVLHLVRKIIHVHVHAMRYVRNDTLFPKRKSHRSVVLARVLSTRNIGRNNRIVLSLQVLSCLTGSRSPDVISLGSLRESTRATW